jgi:hypothetical protein
MLTKWRRNDKNDNLKTKKWWIGGFKMHFLLSFSFSLKVYYPIFYILTLFPFVHGVNN